MYIYDGIINDEKIVMELRLANLSFHVHFLLNLLLYLAFMAEEFGFSSVNEHQTEMFVP